MTGLFRITYIIGSLDVSDEGTKMSVMLEVDSAEDAIAQIKAKYPITGTPNLKRITSVAQLR